MSSCLVNKDSGPEVRAGEHQRVMGLPKKAPIPKAGARQRLPSDRRPVTS